MPFVCDKAYRCHSDCVHAEPHEFTSSCPREKHDLCWGKTCVPATIVVVYNEFEQFPAATEQAIARWFK